MRNYPECPKQLGKNILIISLALFFLLAATTGYAASPDQTYAWHQKLGRGALNIISSPVEVARSIWVSTDEQSMLYGWTVGLIKGLGDGVWRLGAGVIDAVTFPFEFPKQGKRPLVNPEYVWQKPGPRYA